MILSLATLLAFQLAGEVVARALGIGVPGPVIGMAFFLVALSVAPRLAAAVRETAQALLSHLSLLFVPAGVGVVGHFDRLGSDGMALILAIVASTALAIVAGVLAFGAVARLTGAGDE